VKYHYEIVAAGKLTSIPFILSAACSPVLGLLIDCVGKRAHFVCLSSVLLLVAYILALNAKACYQCPHEVPTLVFIGLAYSLYGSSIWATIPYVVPPGLVGTAFGLTMAAQNSGLFIAPLIVGVIHDHTTADYGYRWVYVFFLIVNVIGLALGISLGLLDVRQFDGVLYKVDPGDKIGELIAEPKEEEQEQLIR